MDPQSAILDGIYHDNHQFSRRTSVSVSMSASVSTTTSVSMSASTRTTANDNDEHNEDGTLEFW